MIMKARQEERDTLLLDAYVLADGYHNVWMDSRELLAALDGEQPFLNRTLHYLRDKAYIQVTGESVALTVSGVDAAEAIIRNDEQEIQHTVFNIPIIHNMIASQLQ